ncbi:L,D-transpeptidase family protein [Modestobacter altitudinis]|uniref:L,D-transpeptidase family protein n=1 Tax=Modestobacter altitudinis TaxID=2213158 RepID=UPI001C550E19|nr:L,D-transpeptidase family protein [Modestobacter altitudinis]
MSTTSPARRARARLGRLTALLAVVLVTVVGLGAPSASATAYPSPAGGTRQVIGSILTHYQALGGPGGVLGGPLTDELATPSRYGRYNHFAAGSVYWSPATGAWSVVGAIRDRWAWLGWEAGPLGYPITDEGMTQGGRGRYELFQGGAVYWSPGTGAHQVGGSIFGRYDALGREGSVLGLPTTDELSTPNGLGRYNHFQGGSVYWSPASGAHGVYGAIRDRWAAAGWESSALGFPVSDEYAVPGGRAQDFQRGSISWTPTGGTVVGGATLPLGVTPPGNQVITVVAPSAGSSTATVTAWQRGPGGWSAVLGPVPARVGSAGVGAASESSTRTPAGTFSLTTAFGRAGNPGTALPYRVVDRSDWWVSDTGSPLYNAPARCAPGTCPFDERAGENLYAAGAVYDNAVVIDYNRAPVVRGAGSAFFLHISNGGATAGCVAVDRGVLQQLMRWLDPNAAPVISIGVG